MAVAGVSGVLGICAPAASADQQIATAGSSVDAYGGYTTWLVPSGKDATRAMVAKDGQVRELALPANRERKNTVADPGFSLGADRTGRPVAVFATCSRKLRSCKIRTQDLETGTRTTVANSGRTLCYKVEDVQISAGAIGFTRSISRKARSRPGRTCSPSYSLDTGVYEIKGPAGPHLISREPWTVDLDMGERYLTWVWIKFTCCYSLDYYVTVYDRTTSEKCRFGAAAYEGSEEDLEDSTPTQPTVVGDWVYWARREFNVDDRGYQNIYRRHGCSGPEQSNGRRYEPFISLAAADNGALVVADPKSGINLLSALPEFSDGPPAPSY